MCVDVDDYLDGNEGYNTFQTRLCNGNNCNNVLICYTGTYYQKHGDDRVNNFKPTLCNYDANQVCKTTVSWNSLNGYVFNGECQAQGQCTTTASKLSGDTSTTGTYCCTSQYCNSINTAFNLKVSNSNSNQFNLKFQSNSSQLKSSVLSLFIALLAFKSF
jgi:hypothetical protein